MSAKHFDSGKPDLTQLPRAALEQVAQVMMMGEKKYGKFNFLAGMDWTKLVASTLRHCYKWLDREDIDDESRLPHLAHAVADLLMLIAIIERKRGTDDRYSEPDPKEVAVAETVELIKCVTGAIPPNELLRRLLQEAAVTNRQEELSCLP